MGRSGIGCRLYGPGALLLLAGLLTACLAGSASPVSGKGPALDPGSNDWAPAAALHLVPPAPFGPAQPRTAGISRVDATPTPAESPRPGATLVPSVPLGGPASTAAPVPAPRTFVVLGDSLSVWAFASHGTRASTTGAWPSLLAGMDSDLKLVHNAGVPGNTTTQMLARLRRDVFAYHPDILFVLGGTNDAGDDFAVSTTVANLRKIVEAARAQGIEVVLLTIPPNNALRSSRLARLRQTNTALIALGKADGITVVDVYTALASADGRLPGAYAAADGLHLSTRGEEIVAATIYAQLTAAPAPQLAP